MALKTKHITLTTSKVVFGYDVDLSGGTVDSPDSRENIKKKTTKTGGDATR